MIDEKTGKPIAPVGLETVTPDVLRTIADYLEREHTDARYWRAGIHTARASDGRAAIVHVERRRDGARYRLTIYADERPPRWETYAPEPVGSTAGARSNDAQEHEGADAR